MESDEVIAALEARLRAGEWLGSADLAILFGRDRSTIWRWAKRRNPPKIPFRDLEWELLFDPEVTLRELAKWRLRHGGPDRGAGG